MDYNKYIYDLYMKDIKKYKLLTEEEARDLLIKKSSGDLKARELLINSNQLLVVAMANKRANNYEDILSLIQVGNIGLIKAIDTFNIENNVRLSTYATPMINWEMNHFLVENHSIRLPHHIRKLMNKINNLIVEYHAKGIDYSYESLAADLNITKEKLLYILFSPKIDYCTHDENHTELASDYKLEDQVEVNLAKKYLDEYLDDNLTEDEKNIILYRYGFMNGEYTYEQLAELFNLKKYQPPVIEGKALRKLRSHKSNNRKLLMDAKYIITK